MMWVEIKLRNLVLLVRKRSLGLPGVDCGFLLFFCIHDEKGGGNI